MNIIMDVCNKPLDQMIKTGVSSIVIIYDVLLDSYSIQTHYLNNLREHTRLPHQLLVDDHVFSTKSFKHVYLVAKKIHSTLTITIEDV